MKYIMKGKTYNTETAKELGCMWNGETGLGYYCETLYRKRNGEYFLQREGGALTSCAVPCGVNSWSGSCRAIPLSEAEAQAWAERHLDADEYAAIWGYPAE